MAMVITQLKQNLIQWALNQFSPAQWETFGLLLDADDLLCLQESMTDCRHRRFVGMNDAFSDLD